MFLQDTPTVDTFPTCTSDTDDQKVSSIQNLNDDCLSLLFGYLDCYQLLAVRSVCKRWSNIAIYSFNRLDFSRKYSEVKRRGEKEIQLIQLMQESLKLVNIPFRILKQAVDTAKNILENCPNFETLMLEITESDMWFLETIPSPYFPHLKNLSVCLDYDTYYDCQNFAFDDDSLCNLIRHLPSLETIKISYFEFGMSGISGEFFKSQLRNHKIRSIALNNLQNIQPDLLFYIFNQYFSTLEYLSVTAESYNSELEILSIRNLTKLKYIKMFKFTVTQPLFDLLPLLNLMPSLEKLDLLFTGNMAVDADFLAALVKYCPYINYLSLSCSEHNGPFSNITIRFRDMQHLVNLKLLKTLKLDWVELDFNMFDVLVRNLPVLETLSLSECPQLLDEHVYTAISSIETLSHLNIYGAVNVNCSFLVKCGVLKRTKKIEILLSKSNIQKDWMKFTPWFIEIKC